MSKNYCKNICNFDITDYICTACGRTQEEITEWFTATEERKEKIAKTARKRIKIKKIEIIKGEINNN